MIGVIDYGMGNLGSVVNALRFLEQDVRLIERREETDRCHALILPGVGAFGDCMEHLEQHGFVELIRNWRNRPVFRNQRSLRLRTVVLTSA